MPSYTQLEQILSDPLNVAPSLPDWCSHTKIHREPVWAALIKICEASSGPLLHRQKDYRALETHPGVFVCHDTGVSTYRCGIFEYTDLSMNYACSSAEGLGEIVDFGWWPFYHLQSVDYIKNPPRGLMNSLFASGAHKCNQLEKIREASDRYYGILRDAWLQHYRQLLEATSKRLPFADYALASLRGESLPKDIAVHFPDRRSSLIDLPNPLIHIGIFSVLLMQDGVPVEVHECNLLGDSVYRAYAAKGP